MKLKIDNREVQLDQPTSIWKAAREFPDTTRPLLVWDKKPGDNAATWLPLERGSLILEDVDLLVRDDVAGDEPAACFGAFAGDASAHNVNLMQVDSAKGGIALFRIAGREQVAARAHADSGQHARLE